MKSISNGYRDKDFEEYLDRNKKFGVERLEEKAWYISHPALEEYWDDTKITRVLIDHQPPISASKTLIQQKYLQIWSILVYIGKPGYISEFTETSWSDLNLPMGPTGGPERTTHGVAFLDMLKEFREHQWPFVPVQFLSSGLLDGRQLDERCVLPITYDPEGPLTRPITALTETIVKKVRIHDDCTDFPNKTVVFKEYQRIEHIDAWRKERSIFSSVDHDCKHIVQDLGAFEQANKMIIVLEYANGGSLLDFFLKNQQPWSSEQIVSFWESLLKLCHAIDKLHSLRAVRTSRKIGCAHRDIKPSNILIFRDDNQSTFDFTLKLTDFNTSSNIQTVSSSKTSIQDNNGSRTYCAPEASRFYYEEEYNDREVPLDCDVWSLGCVLSECFVWLAGGEGLRFEYETRRKAELSDVPGVKGSSYEACFHDKRERLRCVTDIHDQATESLNRNDSFSPVVRRLIEDVMLQPSGRGRLDANQVWHQFKIAVKKSKSRVNPNAADLEVQSPSDSGATMFHMRTQSSARGTLSNDTSTSCFSGTNPVESLSRGEVVASRAAETTRDAAYSTDPLYLATNAALPDANSLSTKGSLLVPVRTKHGLSTPVSPRSQHTASNDSWRDMSSTGVASWNPNNSPHSPYHEESTYDSLQMVRNSIGPISQDNSGEVQGGMPQRPSKTNRPFSDPQPRLDDRLHFPTFDSSSRFNKSSSYGPPFTNGDLEKETQPNDVRPRSENRAERRTQAQKTSAGMSEEPYPHVSTEKVLKWKYCNKRDRGQLEGLNDAMNALKDRDMVFVIDDSESMRKNHRYETIQTAEALMYLVKSVDPDGIEMLFTSRPEGPPLKGRQRWIKPSIKPLINKIKTHFDNHGAGTTNMEHALDIILKRPYRRPISFIVFTDGVWQRGATLPGGGVENAIISYVTRWQRVKSRTDATIMFVRFGDDPLGMSRLAYLDDELKNHGDMRGRDIVDHKRYDSSVWSMLIGALSEANDNVQPSRDSAEPRYLDKLSSEGL